MVKKKKMSIPTGALWLIIALLFFGVLWYGGTHDWFKFELMFQNIDKSVLNLLGGGQPGPDSPGPTTPDGLKCTISFSDNHITVGQSTTGTLKDGKNADCYVYMNPGDGWALIHTENTGPTGRFSRTETCTAPGTWVFRALCDVNRDGVFDSGDCLTNQETVWCTAPTSPPNPTDPECSVLCQAAGWDDGDAAINGVCDFGQFYVDNYGNECCCWDEAPDNPVCQSSWPVPSSQDQCYDRPGCPTTELCVYIDGGIMSQSRCECRGLSCDTLCLYEGYEGGYCSYLVTKVPCGTDNPHFDGNQYCTSPPPGGPLIGTCCCET
jgi:hypothetical protein